MKKINNIPTFLILLIYVVVSFLFLRGIFFDKGAIVGGDWGYPITPTQMSKYAQSGFFTWTDRELFGDSQPFLNTLPFQIFIIFLANLKVGGEIYLRILLVFIYVFSAMSMFYMCRFFQLRKDASFVGGLLLITTPLYFNYTAMGWIYMLLALGIMPLTVILLYKSVQSGRVSLSINAGFLVFLASIQSQAIVWFMVLFAALSIDLIVDKKTLHKYILSNIIIIVVFVGLSFYWVFPLIKKVSLNLDSGLSLSTASLGTWVNFKFENIIRLRGSLFNNQFEESFPSVLTSFSYLIPVLLFISLIFINKRRLIISMYLLFGFTVFMSFLGPELISKLPLSDLYRDVGRFTILSSFAYVVVISHLADKIFKIPGKFRRHFKLVFILFIFINTFPFWAGSLSGKQKTTTDIRLRAYEFPSGYYEVENILASSKSSGKTLYLPTDIFLRPLEAEEFLGAYQGYPDIFASYSPIPGKAGNSEKSNKTSELFILWLEYLLENGKMISLNKALDYVGIKYIVIRKNVSYSGKLSGEDIDNLFVNENEFELITQNKDISLFENLDTLPIVHIPSKITLLDNNLSEYDKNFKIIDHTPISNSFIANVDERIKSDIISSIDINSILITYPNNSFEKKYFNIKKESRERFSLPYVRHRPESNIWKIARIKNHYLDKYKWEDSPTGIINKNLFYLSKNISELEKFGDTDETSNYIFEEFRKRSRTIEAELKDCQNDETKKEITLKVIENYRLFDQKIKELSETQLQHKENNTNLYKSYFRWIKEIEETVKRLENYEPKPDITNLNYQLEISEEGDYEITINNSEYKEFTIDGKVTNLMPTSSGNQSSGQVYLNSGEHNLNIQLPYPQNLFTGIWEKPQTIEIKDGVANILSITPFNQSHNGLIQHISNWGEGIYYFSFDYKTSGADLRVGVVEGSSAEPLQSNLIFDTNLNTKNNAWEKFETLVEGSQLADRASAVFFSTQDSQTGSLTEVKNAQIQRITKPIIMVKKQNYNITKNIVLPKIEVFKINPTRFIANVYDVNDSFVINLSESFDPNWKVFIQKNNDTQKLSGELINIKKEKNTLAANLDYIKSTRIPEKNHFIMNDFGNGWYIDKQFFENTNNILLIFDYYPQFYLYQGACVSLFMCLLVFVNNLILLFGRLKLKRY